MTNQEAMKLALEALNELNNENSYWWQEVDEQTIRKIEPAIKALEEALAKQEQGEPVVGTKTWFEDGKVITQNLTAKDLYKDSEPAWTEMQCPICGDMAIPTPQPKQEQGEPVALQMDVIVVNLVREGINKHRARELAEHFIKHTHPQPKREPLTDEWIRSKCNQTWVFDTVKQWVKEVEAAHGIKGEA